MANERKDYTTDEKIKHFSARVGDMSLSQKQRDYAAQRLAALTGNKSSAPQNGNANKSRGKWNGAPSNGNSRVVNVFVHNVK